MFCLQEKHHMIFFAQREILRDAAREEPGVPVTPPPFCKPFLSKQPTTVGKNDSLLSTLTLTQCHSPLKYPGYPPGSPKNLVRLPWLKDCLVANVPLAGTGHNVLTRMETTRAIWRQ